MQFDNNAMKPNLILKLLNQCLLLVTFLFEIIPLSLLVGVLSFPLTCCMTLVVGTEQLVLWLLLSICCHDSCPDHFFSVYLSVAKEVHCSTISYLQFDSGA